LNKKTRLKRKEK